MDGREERKAHGHRTEYLSDADAAAERAARFGKLPRRIEPWEMVEETPPEPPNDPNFNRNPDNDWMIRYSA